MAKTPRWRRRETAPLPTSEDATPTAPPVAPAVTPTPTATPTPTPTATPAATGGSSTATATRLRAEEQPSSEPSSEDGPAGRSEETSEPAFRVGDLTPFLLLRAAHPRQAVLTAVGVAVAAAVSGRPGREVLLVLATVLVGQVGLGWFNDLVDRRRDARHERTGKPVADGRLDPGTLWFWVALAVFLVVPLSIGNGLYAGTAYLASLAVAVVGHWGWLRRSVLSWVPWAASYALLPAFLSYGGWGGQTEGAPPEVLITVLAALLGLGVHLLTALWGLVADNEDHWRYLPLRLGLRLGASRLLWVAVVYTALVLVALVWAGSRVGLSQAPL